MSVERAAVKAETASTLSVATSDIPTTPHDIAVEPNTNVPTAPSPVESQDALGTGAPQLSLTPTPSEGLIHPPADSPLLRDSVDPASSHGSPDVAVPAAPGAPIHPTMHGAHGRPAPEASHVPAAILAISPDIAAPPPTAPAAAKSNPTRGGAGQETKRNDRNLISAHNDAKCKTCGSGGRNLVVCIDGTSNQFSKSVSLSVPPTILSDIFPQRNTNVVELYSRLIKNEHQLTFYNSGIGTYAQPSWKSLGYYKQVLMNKLDLAFAL